LPYVLPTLTFFLRFAAAAVSDIVIVHTVLTVLT